jgi:hypothetical protein
MCSEGLGFNHFHMQSSCNSSTVVAIFDMSLLEELGASTDRPVL